MIRTFYRSSDSTIKFNIPLEDFSLAIADTNSLFWVDIYDEPKKTIKSIYEGIFGFHPLSIADKLIIGKIICIWLRELCQLSM